MEKLEVPTQPAPAELVESARRAARATTAAGLYFPKCAHVLDPLEVVRAFATAATARGASVPAARSARAAHRRRRRADRHRRRHHHGALGHRVRGRVVGAAAGAVRPEGAARSGARLPRADARRDAARRCARPLFRREDRRDAHGRPRARHQLHGVRRRRTRRRIRANPRGCATRCARWVIPATTRPRAGSAPARCCRTIYPPWAGSPRRPTCCMPSAISTSASRCARSPRGPWPTWSPGARPRWTFPHSICAASAQQTRI